MYGSSMKIHDILYLIITALILAYPLYEKKFIKEEYRSKLLYFFYSPLAFCCLILMVWLTISTNIANTNTDNGIRNQEVKSKALIAEKLKISSFEIKTKYTFEYKNSLKAKVYMDKQPRPIKTYLVNSEKQKDSIAFVCNNPHVYYPKDNTVEFNLDFIPENPMELYGKPLYFLSNYEKVYFPWEQVTIYLALFKVGGKVEKAKEPTVSFQIIINGKPYLENTDEIKNLEPGSVILIFQTKPEIFENIEQHFLNL